MTVIEDRVGIGAYERLVGLRLPLVLTFFEDRDGLHDHFGILQKVGADLVMQGGPLGLAEIVEIERMGGQGQPEGQCGGGHKGSNHCVYSRFSAISAAFSTSCARCHAADPRGNRSEARSAWILASFRRPCIA